MSEFARVGHCGVSTRSSDQLATCQRDNVEKARLFWSASVHCSDGHVHVPVRGAHRRFARPGRFWKKGGAACRRPRPAEPSRPASARVRAKAPLPAAGRPDRGGLNQVSTGGSNRTGQEVSADWVSRAVEYRPGRNIEPWTRRSAFHVRVETIARISSWRESIDVRRVKRARDRSNLSASRRAKSLWVFDSPAATVIRARPGGARSEQ